MGSGEKTIRSWNDFVAEVRERIAKASRVVNLRDILMFACEPYCLSGFVKYAISKLLLRG
jgi:hypothetical protein